MQTRTPIHTFTHPHTRPLFLLDLHLHLLPFRFSFPSPFLKYLHAHTRAHTHSLLTAFLPHVCPFPSARHLHPSPGQPLLKHVLLYLPRAMSLSLLADSRKRRRSSADASCVDHFDNGLYSSNALSGSEICHLECCKGCVCTSSAHLCLTQKKKFFDPGHASPPACIADYADSEDSSTGSSCCSSLPGCESSLAELQMLSCMSGAEAEEESWSCCGGDGASEVDIACFFHDDEICDDASNESFSFNPETIFVNEAGFADCSSGEDVPFVGSSAENGSWFLNDLDSQGHAFLNEVLDQEWMAAAVANLEKLNDTLSADSCVLHLLESGKEF